MLDNKNEEILKEVKEETNKKLDKAHIKHNSHKLLLLAQSLTYLYGLFIIKELNFIVFGGLALALSYLCITTLHLLRIKTIQYDAVNMLMDKLKENEPKKN